MKKAVLLAAALLLVAITMVLVMQGTRGRQEEPIIPASRANLGITCKVKIPDELEERATFREKDGSTLTLNARELYEGAYREGWEQYLEQFQSGELDLDETHAEPDLMQEWVLTMNARYEGFQQCRQDILDYEKAHNITFKPLRNPHIKALLNSGADLDFKDYPPANDDEPTGITFRGQEITDADLKPLQHFSRIIKFDAAGTSITDQGLEYLKPSHDLRLLDLGGTLITDKGVDTLLGFQKLEILDLPNTALSDAGVSRLAQLPSLEALTLEGVAVTDQAMAPLSTAPKLRCLYLGKSADESISVDFKPNPSSGTLDVDMQANHPRVIASAPKITDAGLAAIAKMKGLENLGLQGSAITDEGLRELRALPRLQSLRLDHTPITDAGLETLALLKDLDWISLEGTKITDDGLKPLAALPKLETLDLTGCKLTDACLRHLEGCTALKSIYRTNTQITDQGIEELQKKLPGLSKN